MDFGIFYQSNITQWVSALGYVGIAAIIFSETAFFFCFILPGDSLLIASGMLAATNVFNIYIIVPLIILSAFLGYIVGYFFGYYFENWLAKHEDTWYYKKSYEDRARVLMQKYGRSALLYGRLIPVVRTFIPMVAGMVRMPLGMYNLFNLLGAILWGGGITLLGYYLGAMIPNLDDYLWLLIVAIILGLFLPMIWQHFQRKR